MSETAISGHHAHRWGGVRASLAEKGHSWLGYFILSLFFFPLALIMAYVVQDRRVPGY